MPESKDTTGYILLVFVGILLAAGIYIFFHDPVTSVEDNYLYSNGQTTFNVTKVSDIETYTTIYIGEDEQPYLLGLRNDPLSLEDISVTGNVNTRIYGDSDVYVTLNPEANLSSKTTIAALEIDNIIDNELLYDIPVHSAMTMPNDFGYPIATCSDGTDTMTIIWLTLGSETTVYTENYCIVIVGTNEDELIRATDRFLYQLLGIMQ